MEKMTADPVGAAFVLAGILLGILLADLIEYFRVGSVIRLRNRMAKMLIRKYNKGVVLSVQEQLLLDFFHEKGIISQAYTKSVNPKRYHFIFPGTR